MELFLANKLFLAESRKIPTDNDVQEGLRFFCLNFEGLRFQCYFYFTCNGTTDTAKGYCGQVLRTGTANCTTGTANGYCKLYDGYCERVLRLREGGRGRGGEGGRKGLLSHLFPFSWQL